MHSFNRDQVRKELERDEGRKRRPYRDSKGIWTVGVGWNLEANALPDTIIDQLLEISIDRAVQDLDVLEPRWRELDPDRQAVLINAAVNLGRPTFAGFHRFWAAVREWLLTRKDECLDRAACELMNSDAAEQTGGRYVDLAARFRAKRI